MSSQDIVTVFVSDVRFELHKTGLYTNSDETRTAVVLGGFNFESRSLMRGMISKTLKPYDLAFDLWVIVSLNHKPSVMNAILSQTLTFPVGKVVVATCGYQMFGKKQILRQSGHVRARLIALPCCASTFEKSPSTLISNFLHTGEIRL